MHFNSIEEIIANDLFLAWYFKTNEQMSKEWELWLLEHENDQLLVKQSIEWLRDHYIDEKVIAPVELEVRLQKLNSSLDAAPVVQMKPRTRRWWIPAAAVVLLIAGFVYWSSLTGKTVLRSNYGSISEYTLPDGSTITLDANSELRMNKEWRKNNDREVWLKGEAFFKIQKTPMKNKFTVHTNNMDIIVTGTQFNAISREDETSVLLTEGSVTVKTSSGDELKMKPGDFVRLDGGLPAKKPADQDRLLAWKQAKLDFENTRMTDVGKIITRHYGIKVNISDSAVARKTISGVMPNDNLDVLIAALEATGEFKITKSKNEIIISKQ